MYVVSVGIAGKWKEGKMPQEVNACKFGELVYNERSSKGWVRCGFGRSAMNVCLTQGCPECKDYQGSIFYTAEEMRQKIKEERNDMA